MRGAMMGVMIALGGAPSARSAPLISELMASNDTTIADQDGDYADWIEVYNPDKTADSLAGWYLTDKADNPTKWQVPAVTLAAGQSLVIFCSSKNYTNPAQPLATNFNLPAGGGYVALVEPDGATIASAYTFPVQYPDISYGVSQPSDPTEAPQIGYFAVATPGAANGNYTNILLPNQVSVSVPAGIFTGTKTVSLSGAVGGQHIRYVLAAPSAAGDSIAPPTAASPLYIGPLTIASTQLLRAAVFTPDDSQRGLPTTAMYVQLDNSTANRLDTFASNLPLVVFDNNGIGLLPDNDVYYPAWIGAFSPGSGGTATLTQTPDFFAPDGMKLHGFSSATWPKQSYDMDLSDDLGEDLDEPFFGLDADPSWGAIAVWYYDRTYIHNAFVYALSNAMGHWAPASKFAEMFIHNAGGPLDSTSYAGITSLTDRLKVGPNRINIASISTSDVTAPNVTGGYVLRIDHPESDLYSWTTTQGTTVMVDTPKLDVIVAPQVTYITTYVQQMENAMAADQAAGYATRNYLSYLDRPSWVDYHLLNVFVENVDAFLYSEYFTKDMNGLIKAGPTWDYDRSMGSADGRDANPQQWTPTADGDYWNAGWWAYLTHDPDFMQAWVDRWESLRLSLLSNQNLLSTVTGLAAQIGPAAAARDGVRWPYVPSSYPATWPANIAAMESWLGQRAQWIDQQFVAAPIVNPAGTGTVLLPPAGAQVAYTLDGSDPRLSGGGLSPTARLGTGPVTLAAGQTWMARGYNAGQVGVYPGSPWSSPVTTASVTANLTGQFINVSVLNQAGNGVVLTQGFVISGAAGSAKQVLIRGVGPALSQYGVAGFLAKPVLSVFGPGGILLAANTGWSTNANAAAIASAAAAVGAFALPAGSADCALLLTLSPGSYTMQVTGVGSASGSALSETYQVTTDTSQVANVSCLAQAGTAASPLTSGFIISGGPAQVLVRADGPALAQYGVAGLLAQPQLRLYDGNSNLIATNAGWGANANAAQIAAAAAATGAFPLAAGSADSALLLTLPPGSYSMQVSGAGTATGNALAEAYIVPGN